MKLEEIESRTPYKYEIHDGLKNQCADIVTILTGHANHSGLTDTQICFADSDGDGTDFPGDGFSSPSYGPKTLRQGDGYLGIGSGGT